MFSGIIEALGRVTDLDRVGGNLHIWIEAPFHDACYIDQSIAHDGVCLTIDQIEASRYRVTAIEETLQRTNLGQLTVGDSVNLERSTSLQSRLDGHVVQGHVDATCTCHSIQAVDGSTYAHLTFDRAFAHLIVPKGSVTLNGVSLTIVDPTADSFAVAIIPYTYTHTTFQYLQVGDTLNIEFDIIGKYVARFMEFYQKK